LRHTGGLSRNAPIDCAVLPVKAMLRLAREVTSRCDISATSQISYEIV